MAVVFVTSGVGVVIRLIPNFQFFSEMEKAA